MKFTIGITSEIVVEAEDADAAELLTLEYMINMFDSVETPEGKDGFKEGWVQLTQVKDGEHDEIHS
jgi:hypothetical protein